MKSEIDKKASKKSKEILRTQNKRKPYVQRKPTTYLENKKVSKSNFVLKINVNKYLPINIMMKQLNLNNFVVLLIHSKLPGNTSNVI